MLVDPELAERARALLREPHEANGKGTYMSALGTHEITAGMSLGLEPPLSPPVVRGPLGSAMPAGDHIGLPTPPPAIRPPESAPSAPAPAPPPAAEVPQQPQPDPAPAPAPAPVQPESLAPILPPEPVQALPERELPTMAPLEPAAEPAAPVIDYFSEQAPEAAVEAVPEPAPVEEPAATEPAEEHHVEAIPLIAPAPAPTQEPAAELPTMAPAEAAPQPEPAAFVAPQPAELAALAPEVEIEPEVVTEVVAEVEPYDFTEPAVEPVAASPELEELFAPKHSEFRVVVRLKDAEGVEVGSFRDFGTAMEGAQEVIEQFSNATEGQWPFYAGRFIRPDLIVSVDVVDGETEER